MHRDGDGEDGRLRIILGAVGAVLGVVLVILFVSMAVVDPLEYGLVSNRFNFRVNPESKGPGRHIIGPVSRMLTFPSTVQNMEFSSARGAIRAPIRARTDDGLEVILELSFQYQLRKDDLFKLYSQVQLGYENLYARVAADILLKRASTYAAMQYWTERENISQSMLTTLDETLSLSGANCVGLQLKVINLPATFEQKIVDTEVQRQLTKTRQEEQKAAITRAEISVLISEFSREARIIYSNATATAALIERTATANAQSARIDVEREVLANITETLGLSPKGLIEYQRGIAYQDLDNASLLFGASNAIAVVNKAPLAQTQDMGNAYAQAAIKAMKP